MTKTRTILVRGRTCPVLRDVDGVLLVDGPKGQEWAKRQAMARIQAYTEKQTSELTGCMGDCVEYEGCVLQYNSEEWEGGEGISVTLEQIAEPESAESPEPFEHFMARHKLTITSIGVWGYRYVPAPAPMP